MNDVIHGLLFGGGMGTIFAVAVFGACYIESKYGQFMAFAFCVIVGGALVGALLGAA